MPITLAINFNHDFYTFFVVAMAIMVGITVLLIRGILINEAICDQLKA